MNAAHADFAIAAKALDVGYQSLECGPLHVAAGESWVVVVVGHSDPALGALAGDVGMPGVALGINRVVFLVQSFFAGLACVDRAAHAAFQYFAHLEPPFLAVDLAA
jgi:hypothetical protein